MSHHAQTQAVGCIASCQPRRLGLLARIGHAFALRRQRLHLDRLDDAALRDIGLTRRDVDREVSRPMWDAPDHWLR
ncbi:DUF1127 domain-containing protein [Aliiroseovarius sp. YM-037]|uniref:DUF1127 domain-containing protein n=1 Tax=Aliiroseovarius sp. YM-037 TaxID=3341728 RepID=UPI003A8024A7